MKKLIQLKLKFFAKIILAKYKPEVIGITGSVGKTSAKEAVYAVLSRSYNVRRNIKNYNNEIGVPCTIIGKDSPGKSIFGWFGFFLYATKLILFKDKDFPEILILEMGVDKPGDMKYLHSIVKPKVGIVTLIGPVHLEFFGSLANIQKEKGEIIKRLHKSGWTILNIDNKETRELEKFSKSKTITYGFSEKAKLRAQEISFSFSNISKTNGISNLAGVSFKLTHSGSFVPVMLPNVLGETAVYAALAGAAVGIAFGMNLVEISESLQSLKSPKGRMNLIKGIKNTLIIDDTYNSSPQATISALDVVKQIPINLKSEKFAVLGDMLELGSYSKEGHQEVGRYLVKSGITKLIIVGERSIDIGKGASSANMRDDNIFHFDTSQEAGKFVQDRIEEGDLILVKGSQGVRMEKVVKEIMAEPLRAKELLCRQDVSWLKK